MDTNVEVGGRGSEMPGQPPSRSDYAESISDEAKIRILVLDEQPLLRQGIIAYLNSQPDMTVCGEAGSISEAHRKIAECQPQLLITALRLGAEDSLKLIRKLKAKTGRLRILVYSAFAETIFAERAIRAGASGYVMKQAPKESLAAAIRDVHGGGIYVSREAAMSAFQRSLERPAKTNYVPRAPARLEELSDREMHVFQLLGSGLGNRQIAASLDLSVKTVESHRENIKHKLRLSSGAQLRQRATKWVEQSFRVDEHLFHTARRVQEKKLPSISSPAVIEELAGEAALESKGIAQQPVLPPPPNPQ